MKKIRKTLTFIIVLGLTLVSYNSFAQRAEELLPKAIQLEEVKGELNEAIKTYQLILDQYPDNREICAEALLHLGICYEKLGLDQARQTYQQVISKYPEQEDKAAMARDRIYRLNAYNAELLAEAEEHLKRGNELFKRWEYESAIKEYENVVLSGPNSDLALNARYCIGQSWYRAGKYDKALVTFTKLIEENPKSNIAPVAELMVAQVNYTMKNDKIPIVENYSPDQDKIIDPETAITFRKINSLSGESDIITFTVGLNLSPNGKFLLFGNMVVPMDGTAPFELIDFKSTGVQATRGTWSPDGTKAAFYSGDALCVVPVSPETGHATGPFKKIIKDNLKYERNPNWSPDSKKICYGEGDKADLCIIGADGDDFKKITDNDILESGGAWSPDGKTIAYNLEDRYIGLYDINKEEFSKLVETRTRNFPVWSPDSNWIIDGYWGEVYLINLDNRKEFRFSPPREVGSFFSWSHDKSKMLFFQKSYNFTSRLKIASPDGGPSYEPVPLLTDYWHLWRDDSNSLAVWGEDEDGNIVIRITPISGGRSDIIHIDEIPGGKFEPSLNIDSKFTKIIFSVKTENGERDLYVVPISAETAKTTGPPVKFYDNFPGDIMASLSSDGEKIAFTRERDIWIAFTNGDDPIRITDFQEVNNLLGWTPDGTSLLFSTPSGWRLLKNPGPQGKIIKLLDEGKEIESSSRFHIAISPDNSWVAALTDQQIKIIPINDTKSSKVLDISYLELNDCYELSWSPDGKNLAFIGSIKSVDKTPSPDRKFGIFNVPINGGPATRIAPDDDDVKDFLSWSPDGKWIAFGPENAVKVRPESSIWEADFDEVINKLAK